MRENPLTCAVVSGATVEMSKSISPPSLTKTVAPSAICSRPVCLPSLRMTIAASRPVTVVEIAVPPSKTAKTPPFDTVVERRVQERDGIPASAVRSRMAAQPDIPASAATVIIENDGSPEKLEQAVNSIIKTIQI